jgi:hypothetical protein
MSFAHAHNARALSCSPASVSGFFARVTEVQRTPASAVEIEGRVKIGGRAIDPGLYRVRVDEARERIVLENDDRTYALTAFFRRPRNVAAFPTSAWLEQGEGGRTFICVSHSNGCEWVA